MCQNLTSCHFEEKTGFNCAMENRVEHRLDEKLTAKTKKESCMEMAMFGKDVSVKIIHGFFRTLKHFGYFK